MLVTHADLFQYILGKMKWLLHAVLQAVGIRMVLGDRLADVPDWQEQLDYEVEPPVGGLVGPARYSPALKKMLRGALDFKSWIQCDQIDKNISKINENIDKTAGKGAGWVLDA